jgi:hypothetical protein
MGTGQIQVIAQQIDKKGPVFDIGRHSLAVHREFDCGHACYLPDVFVCFN